MSPCLSFGTNICSVQARKAVPFIGPSSTQGARKPRLLRPRDPPLRAVLQVSGLG